MKVSLESKVVVGLNLLAGVASLRLKPKAGLIALIAGIAIGICVQSQAKPVMGTNTSSTNKFDEMMAKCLPRYGVMFLSAAALCVTLSRIGVSYISGSLQSFIRQNMIPFSTLVLGYYLGKCLLTSYFSRHAASIALSETPSHPEATTSSKNSPHLSVGLPASNSTALSPPIREDLKSSGGLESPKDQDRDKYALVDMSEEFPEEAEKYFELASLLENDGKINVNGKIMGARDLYIEVIRLDPSCDEAYSSLAWILDQNETIKLADGTQQGPIDLYLTAIKLHPDDYYYYVNLGYILLRDTVEVNGRKMNNFDLYLHAIELDPEKDYAYRCIADSMGEGVLPDAVEFNGKTWSREDLYIKAIDCDPENEENYVALASTLQDNQKVTLLDQTEMTKEELLLKSIEVAPSVAAYVDLLEIIEKNGGTITLEGGTLLDQREINLEFIKHFPDLPYAYHALAKLLENRESIELRNGKMMTKRTLYWFAIERDRTYASAYLGLALSIRSEDSVVLPFGCDKLHRAESSGQFSWSKQQLFNAARRYYFEELETNPDDAETFWNLGHLLLHTDPEGMMQLPNGDRLTSQDLIQRARDLDEEYKDGNFKV